MGGCCVGGRRIDLRDLDDINTITKAVELKNKDLQHNLEDSIQQKNPYSINFNSDFMKRGVEIYNNLRDISSDYDNSPNLNELKNYLIKFYENEFIGEVSAMLTDYLAAMEFIKKLKIGSLKQKILSISKN